jgi:glycosyltransferase involved in cell wall biosynthesis
MKFTIGIPAFKATFLKECIDSVLSQTYTNFEIVIVNDASPENLDAIVETYHSDKIKYVKNEKNFGAINVVDNWNKCLSYATGEFFILMGDDDKMAPNYLSEFVNLIHKYPACGVYHCRTLIINEKSEPIRLTEPRPEFESVYDSILERMKGTRLFFISDYVYRTETLRENNGFYKLPLAWASDDISSYIAAHKNGIAHTNEPVFMYRQNPLTISSTGNVNIKMDAIMQEGKWLQNFVAESPENKLDKLIRINIQQELRLFIQKKKIRTIYSGDTSIGAFIKWFSVRKKYQLSIPEIIYAVILSLKEKSKVRYE